MHRAGLRSEEAVIPNSSAVVAWYNAVAGEDIDFEYLHLDGAGDGRPFAGEAGLEFLEMTAKDRAGFNWI